MIDQPNRSARGNRWLAQIVALLLVVCAGLALTLLWLVYDTLTMPQFSPVKSESWIDFTMLALLLCGALVAIATALRMLMRPRS